MNGFYSCSSCSNVVAGSSMIALPKDCPACNFTNKQDRDGRMINKWERLDL